MEFTLCLGEHLRSPLYPDMTFIQDSPTVDVPFSRTSLLSVFPLRSKASLECWSAATYMATKPHPPLMKKHSQTDLVSRLKTRKILGVGGEDDDGEVHRSKISQVLGNEIKFAVREPLGLRVWLLVSAVLFTAVALMALTFPNQLYDAVFDEELSGTKMSIRLYGGALLSISLIMWNGLYTAEKAIIQWTLLTEACYFGVQFLVRSCGLCRCSDSHHSGGEWVGV
ncbi:tumor protein p53-inducible protein 11 isoform X2 [Lepisosteus oculatus]|uniref:tumor protein p53-inducible protein 11 isoform X2 n=1 Tax=Lepisosteus oculatus TaxID=7918 RepID=UPI0035F50786